MKSILLLLLAVQVLSQTVLVSSNPTTTTVLPPVTQTVVVQSYHTINQPNYLGNGAQWIFLSGSDAWPNNFNATFQTLFYVDCPQVVALLTVTADNVFTAYVNGVPAGTGNDWLNKYSWKVQLKCGLNNLTTVVTNLDASTPAAVIFSVVQNQAGCYACPENPADSFYNRDTCECQCVAQCDCPSKLHQWFDYPHCNCQCPPLFAPCKEPKFLNKQTCQCQCKKIWCPKGQIQNQSTCACQCQKIVCPPPLIFDKNSCKCVKYLPIDSAISPGV